MIIVNICGGLGNQMFQYAAGRRLALHRGTELKLDLTGYRDGAEARPTELAAFRRPVRLNDLNIVAAAASDREIFRLRDRFIARSTRDRLVRRVRRYIKSDFLWPPSHIVEAWTGVSMPSCSVLYALARCWSPPTTATAN